ncbi:MAG: ATP-dependent Lon protease [Actinomycetota bacterium]|nr:ATP-dependent Lon protease [Actinomycetota bacterium]
MSQVTTRQLPVVPLDSGVVLPHMVVTVGLEQDEAKAAIEAAGSGDGLVLLVPRTDGRYGRIGTVAKLEDSGELPNGDEAAVVRGLHRAVIETGVAGTGGALWVRAEPSPDPEVASEHASEMGKEYRALIETIIETRGGRAVTEFLRGISNPGHLADTSGYSPVLSHDQKLEVLETLDVEERLTKLIAWAKEDLAELSLKEKIRNDVSEGMEKTQREFLLRQQMAAIKKELGDDEGDVVAEYRTKIDEAGMPEDVLKEVERELGRLERTSDQNPEHGWIRNYLDWMVELPWSTRSDDRFDIAEARRILDEDHTGLDDVKDRIVEFLAVKKLRADRGVKDEGGRGSGAIITLVGPPGVGKTSLGESVARALGRKFARVSLGGIHDEAEIRGHRRTYIGALPGRIVRALKEAGTKNPVIMLDEIDKVGNDWRGDPSSALLEVLDPAQNHSFRDHFLEVDLDLSEVLFIPTANVWETIPGPLLDRMELVRLDGYTDEEKLAIAKNHLLARQLERNGLSEGEVALTDDALRSVITDHTREAGVRNLEREIGKVLRNTVTKIASGDVTPPATVDVAEVREYLGRPKFHFEAAERTTVPGVATGLAVTGTGGDVLFIEATAMEGEAGLTLTGQLGDVMKESAQIALSYVRGHAAELGIEESFDQKRFHVHVPAGAVPKDGPSAGVTMTTAITSLLTGRPVRSTVGMTGEVTLQGKVLPIGGVKQKVLAAHRAGLTEVILPHRNEGDLDDLPESIREEMKIHLASSVDEVLAVALEPVATGSEVAA